MKPVAVLNPAATAAAVDAKTLAPRLERLDGKRVFLLDCRFDNSSDVIAQVAAWLAERRPGIQVDVRHWASEGWSPDVGLLAEAGETADAVVLGVGL